MQVTSYHIVAALLCLVVSIREGMALSCVVCNDVAEKDCNTNLKKYEKVCPLLNDTVEATSCRKMEQEIYFDDDYNTRTIRQCAYESGPMKCIERIGTYRFKVYYCHCKGDNCNSAGSLSISLVLASFSTAVAILLKL